MPDISAVIMKKLLVFRLYIFTETGSMDTTI